MTQKKQKQHLCFLNDADGLICLVLFVKLKKRIVEKETVTAGSRTKHSKQPVMTLSGYSSSYFFFSDGVYCDDANIYTMLWWVQLNWYYNFYKCTSMSVSSWYFTQDAFILIHVSQDTLLPKSLYCQQTVTAKMEFNNY